MNDPKNLDQWKDRVSKSISKDDLPKDAWERILKIRHFPIKLIEDVRIGDRHKPHVVLPSGLKGYLLEYPEAFFLEKEHYEALARHKEVFEGKNSEIEGLPAILYDYDDIVFLHDYEYEITDPFFDRNLADYAESVIRKGGTDAGT